MANINNKLFAYTYAKINDAELLKQYIMMRNYQIRQYLYMMRQRNLRQQENNIHFLQNNTNFIMLKILDR